MNTNRSDYEKNRIIKFCLSITPGFARELSTKILFWKFWKRQQKKRTSTFEGYSLIPFDKHQCIFVHVPKCAGVSVSKTLFGCLAGGHMELWKYQLIFGEKTFNEYFKFTIVRNPWDRLYSAFCFLKAGGFGERDERWFAENVGADISFEYFVKNILSKKNIMQKNHFSHQVHFLKDLSGKVNLNYIARFENLAEEITLLSKRLGSSDNLVRSNVTKNKKMSYVEAYDSNMIEIVGDIYRKDIDQFKYNFKNN